jgi:hypothetical protein
MSPLWKFAWAVSLRTSHLMSQIPRISLSAKPVSGEASRVAQALKVVRLDRFACCGLELYDMMAIAEENAGYSDRSAPVRRRSAKFSITPLVMHLPVHRIKLRLRAPHSTDPAQETALPRCNPVAPCQYSKGPSSNNQLAAAWAGMRQLSTSW